jgi:hypothetical protein
MNDRCPFCCSQPSEQFLFAFFDPFNTTKTLQVGQSNVGDHAMRRLSDFAQIRDFSLVIGPHFHEGKFSVDGHRQQGEGHAYVVVQIAMGGVHVHILAQYSPDKLLRGGLSIAPCQAKDGGLEAPSVGLSQELQCGETIRYLHDARSLNGGVVHDGGGTSFGYGLMGKSVSIEALPFQSDVEQSRPAFPGVSGDTFGSVEEGEKLLWRGAFHGHKKQRTPLDLEVKRGSESTLVGAYLPPAITFPLGEPTRVIAQRKPMVAELWSSSKKRRVPGMIQ